ncbi:hypothetical protein EVAR_96950_1 [Eumeta japonica]|uniref:Uncharacterized protein n=1 Tax=Eumeta variegata TaxID=151549 RepID=A0A4C1VFB1_EUMVA|nr:hypothetical protein EVAR_96950_1 [Eumeta japonica]
MTTAVTRRNRPCPPFISRDARRQRKPRRHRIDYLFITSASSSAPLLSVTCERVRINARCRDGGMKTKARVPLHPRCVTETRSHRADAGFNGVAKFHTSAAGRRAAGSPPADADGRLSTRLLHGSRVKINNSVVSTLMDVDSHDAYDVRKDYV